MRLLFRPRILQLLALFLLFAVLLIGVKNQSQSWYFQDETEHVAVGWMITNFDRQLYDNLSTNHQPLPVLVGGLAARAIPYGTLFEFIDRLRLSMWLFAFACSAAIVVRFQWRGLLAVGLTYSLGHYFFAWHVLAESLVTPAAIWMLLSILGQKLRRGQTVVFGFAAFWIVFSLLPLWPFVTLTTGYAVWQKKIIDLRALFAGLLIPTVIVFLFVNPFQWWQETVVNNVQYFIPFEAANDTGHYLRLVVYPLLHLAFLQSVVARFYVVVLATILVSGFLARKKPLAYKKLLFLSLIIYSLNPRTSQLNATFYNGFHLFPYVAGLSVVFAALFEQLVIWASASKKTRKLVFGGLCGIGLLLFNNLPWVWEKRDKLSDYYIQYNTFQAYGTALNILRKPADTLLTGPNGWGYLNMMANIPFAGRQNFHLPWAFRVPYLREAWLEMVRTSPPTFVVFNLGDDGYSQVLRPLIASQYLTLSRSDGSPTVLLINKTAAAGITDQQWADFEAQSFRRPSLE